MNVANRKKFLGGKGGGDANAREGLENEGRFRDYDTLRYAMRSVLAHFEALRYIFLVIADGEALPVWLDLDQGKGVVRVVRHSEIMPKDVLPTFNSNAIEANLHLIPNLSPCFAYLNDDMMYGRKIPLSVYWVSSLHRQLVHLGQWKAPLAEFLQSNSWHQAIALNNDRLNKHYGTDGAEHEYPMHGCYFFHRDTFAKMHAILKPSWDLTLETRVRSHTDNVVSFLYPHVAMQEFGARRSFLQLVYMTLSPDESQNIGTLRNIVKRRPQCICINDGLEDGKRFKSGSQRALLELRWALEILFPDPAPWERKELIPSSKARIPKKYFDGPGVSDIIVRLAIGIPLAAICLIVCICCVAECCFRK